ncbi:hypothetical protein RHSP_41337 (plasmid) [Rhizobium freirei PRF 81]|uniref:Transmembrane protein n=1 Tax=Rhizobium freirei PRF 81 TaxID=363754 RepID=N6U096_9HYPH|nr:hypothetical protein [Rhizobium freirei]ENN83828.1 hypothetical protein RHSP_41337 [Rhizobium freirei PRF 81]
MRDQRIVIHEPARKPDPDGVKYWGLLWLAVIVLLLASWGLSWMWREAGAVIRHPFEAPFYTLMVLAIFALAHGILVWSAFRILRRLFSVGRAMILALADLVSGLLRGVRNRLFRIRT